MDWDLFFKEEKEKEYFINLMDYLKTEYENKTIYPKYENIFEAFKLCNLDNLKIVIIGQDPYINENEAHGLAFSTLNSKYPPSLKNILEEINNNFNINRTNGNFSDLASQGILFLNTILTVEAKKSLSHKNIGWEKFTLNLMKFLNNQQKPIVFMLWGNDAIKYQKYLTNNKFLILTSSHPSPLSVYRGFRGCKHFSIANEYLKSNNINIINY